MNRRLFTLPTLVAALLLALFGCADEDRPGQSDTQALGTTAAPEYVGAKVCAECHRQQVDAWQGSDHALAMQPATDAAVLGAFDDAAFAHQGVTSRFYRRDDGYFVTTDGPDGALTEFPVRYTFGVDPLQQYLLELPDGRIQALGAAWDSRPAEDGGQRWIHVYGDEPIDHRDVLHWTGPAQNWDSMCAFCHSTNLHKTFDLNARTFDTSWSEVNVACEACHGPGSRHVEITQSGALTDDTGSGFTAILNERDQVTWILNKATGNSRRSEPRQTEVEIETCAACHSRRGQIAAQPRPGDAFLDGFRPALLSEPLYHVDGQIRDEVYVWGSFLQSKMYQQGVTCSDCHEPHQLELRAPGSGVCLQCHAAEKFAAETHHFHLPDSAGAECVECHMPATTYMQVDDRRDHSFRIPRPDLGETFATPDACTNCHTDKAAAWAAAVLRDKGRAPAADLWQEQLAEILRGRSGARQELTRLMANSAAPDIVRASALLQLPFLGDAGLLVQNANLVESSDPLMRWAIVRALQFAPEPVLLQFVPPLLADPVRLVRIEAANALAGTSLELLPVSDQSLLQSVLDEYIAAELVSNERAEAHVNIGNLQRRRNRSELAREAYQTALERNAQFVPAWVNLADLYREQDNEIDSEAVLREGLALLPNQPALHYSLGLSLFRQGKGVEARGALQVAAESEQAEPRMAMAYALLIDAQGETEQAVNYLQAARSRFGDDPGLLSALINIYQRTNRQPEALQLISILRGS